MVHREMGTVVTTVYQVETTYPGSDPDKFGTYYAYAYTDVRDPGREAAKMLVNTMPELFGHDVRTGRDGLTYRTPDCSTRPRRGHGSLTVPRQHPSHSEGFVSNERRSRIDNNPNGRA
jgi:hypothetical protein